MYNIWIQFVKSLNFVVVGTDFRQLEFDPNFDDLKMEGKRQKRHRVGQAFELLQHFSDVEQCHCVVNLVNDPTICFVY